LTTIANAAAFTRNQDSLREAGVLIRLPNLLATSDRGIKEAAVLAAANLSLNIGNMKEMEPCVTVLILLAETCDDDLNLQISVLECLTNISVLPDWHQLFLPLLQPLLNGLTSPHSSLRLQSLRLLINLVCNNEMLSPLLCTASPSLTPLLTNSTPEEQLLRCCTFVANVCVSSSRQNMCKPTQQDFMTKPNSFQTKLFVTQLDTIVKQALYLRDNHDNTEIKFQASKIYTVLNGLQS